MLNDLIMMLAVEWHVLCHNRHNLRVHVRLHTNKKEIKILGLCMDAEKWYEAI